MTFQSYLSSGDVRYSFVETKQLYNSPTLWRDPLVIDGRLFHDYVSELRRKFARTESNFATETNFALDIRSSLPRYHKTLNSWKVSWIDFRFEYTFQPEVFNFWLGDSRRMSEMFRSQVNVYDIVHDFESVDLRTTLNASDCVVVFLHLPSGYPIQLVCSGDSTNDHIFESVSEKTFNHEQMEFIAGLVSYNIQHLMYGLKNVSVQIPKAFLPTKIKETWTREELFPYSKKQLTLKK